MTVITNSKTETMQLGFDLAQTLRPGTVLAFYGDLGAGKTTFTKGLAAGLGISDPITSPTYTIVNEYETGETPLIHFDMYRLGSADDLFEIGWDDYLERGAILAVEWSEHVEAALPSHTVRVRIEQSGDTQRVITITGMKEGAAYADIGN